MGTLDTILSTQPAVVQQFHAQVREYAREQVAPRAIDLDLDPHDSFAHDLIQMGHELGLTRAMLPPDRGGLGIGVVGVCLSLEELAVACPGIALAFGATMLAQAPVLLSGDLALQERFLSGFSGTQASLACNAVCEEDAGVDLVIPQNTQYARNISTIRRDGDHYVLNGHKRVITNAAVADFAAVFAKVEGSPSDVGLSVLIVPLDASGVERGPVADKMGYRNVLGSELTFTDVRVPVGNLVGGEGAGLDILVAQGNMARSSVAAMATGVARHALELAVDFCGERIQGGKPLKDHQMTARKLAEMASKVDASRLMYVHAADRVDNELPAPEYEPAAAKFFADRVAIEVASEGVSLLGSRGYIREFGMEKVLRDAYGTRIFEGTPEALALAITDCLYRKEDEDDWL